MRGKGIIRKTRGGRQAGSHAVSGSLGLSAVNGYKGFQQAGDLVENGDTHRLRHGKRPEDSLSAEQ